jgi:hypothetical protein
MRIEGLMKRTQKSLLFSVLIVNGLLLFAYRVPKNSYFSGHDFLDHMFVLYKIRGENPHFFDYSASLNGVLGSIPLSALSISDFSLDANMYVLFDAPIAAVLNEFISRNIAFLGMYFFLRKLLPLAKSKYVVLAPSMLFAMLPYYPNFQFTIAFVPIISYVVLTSFSEPLRPFKISLIVLASLFGNFTYGGFAVVGFVFILFLAQIVRRDNRVTFRLLAILLVLASGYLLGISRILFLKFTTEFNSHRLSWQPIGADWFDPTFLKSLAREFFYISLKGNYHFPSGQAVFTKLFIPGLPLVLLVLYIGMQIVFFVQKKDRPRSELKEFRLANSFLGAILIINLFYSSEASGFTRFESLMQEPFQFKRVAILLPFLWCALAALILNSIAYFFPQITILSFLFVVCQISVSNIGVQQQILHYAGIQGSQLTIKEYFDSEEYSGLARKLNRQPSEIRVLSFDLDPMIASFNGYVALDGYVYNYPLEYKDSFRRIIAGELVADRSLREYYDNWGSRVYLSHRNLPVNKIKIDWCAAQDIGAEYILSKKDLSSVANLKPTAEYKSLILYKFAGC